MQNQQNQGKGKNRDRNGFVEDRKKKGGKARSTAKNEQKTPSERHGECNARTANLKKEKTVLNKMLPVKPATLGARPGGREKKEAASGERQPLRKGRKKKGLI